MYHCGNIYRPSALALNVDLERCTSVARPCHLSCFLQAEQFVNGSAPSYEPEPIQMQPTQMQQQTATPQAATPQAATPQAVTPQAAAEAVAGLHGAPFVR
jgi:hypothetical protein